MARAAATVEKTLRAASRLPPLPTPKDIVRLYKLRAMKHLSQNFLLDQKYTNRIVKAAGKMKGYHVCEVGPGPGSITRSILEKGAAELVVVEKDQRFLPSLELLADAANVPVKILIQDILETEMNQMFPKELSKTWEDQRPLIHIIGNLPFNISTPLIIKWLKAMSEHSGIWSYGRVRLTLTFQKEVAERMVAPINSSQRCRLSVMCQYLTKPDHRFTIPGRAFIPKPDVDVGVVRFTPLKTPLINQPFWLVEKVMRHVFHFRRKYCQRGVETLFPETVQDELTKEIFRTIDVNPTARSYNLTIEELSRMCDAYRAICDRIPGIEKYEYRIPKSVIEWSDFHINSISSNDETEPSEIFNELKQ